MRRAGMVIFFSVMPFVVSPEIPAEEAVLSAGELVWPDCIAVTGTETFSENDIVEALMDDWEVFVAAHPDASRERLLNIVRRKVAAGYKRTGFTDVQVNVAFSEDEGRIVLTVQEGPRYMAGNVIVAGSELVPEEEIIDALKSLSNAVDEDDEDVEKLVWKPGSPAPADELILSSFDTAIKGVYGAHGYLYPEFIVKMLPREDKGIVTLLVVVEKEGPLCRLVDVEVTSTVRNKPEDVVAYLEIEPGEVLTTGLIERIEQSLVDSARFLSVSVEIKNKEKAEEKKTILVNVKEYDEAPLISEELPPEFQAFLKFGDWLMGLTENGEDIVINVKGYMELEAVLSFAKGIFVSSRAPGHLGGEDFIYAATTLDNILFVDDSRKIKHSYPGNSLLCMTMIMAPSKSPGDDGNFEFAFAATWSSTKDEDQPVVYATTQFAPVAFLGLVAKHKDKLLVEGGIASLDFGDGSLLRLDVATGRLLEGHFIEEEGKEYSVFIEKDALTKRLQRLEEKSKDYTIVDNPGTFYPAMMGFVADVVPWEKTFDYGTEEQRLKAASLVRKFAKEELPAIWEELFAGVEEEDKEEAENFVVSAPALRPALQIPLAEAAVRMLGSAALKLPPGAWQRVILRDICLVIIGETSLASEDLKRLYSSKEIGPSGCFITAVLTDQFNPAVARSFAAKGLSDLSAEAFRKDYRMFLELEGVPDNAVKVIRWLNGIDKQYFDNSISVCFEKETAEMFLGIVDFMRKEEVPAAGEQLSTWLDKWWDAVLMKSAKAGLVSIFVKSLLSPNVTDEERLPFLLQAARHGNAKVQYLLGAMYYYGDGVQQDYAEAAKWYRKAAEQGYAKAQYAIGFMYTVGRGVTENHEEAAKWYRKAAEQKYAEAQFVLGSMYYEGKGVTKDYVEAAKWYRKAAEQEYAKAQYYLALRYRHGKGVPQDYAKAVKWLRKAAEQEYAEAQFILGAMYYEGKGVTKDYVEAAKWYRKAAEQEYAEAQYYLALRYRHGKGVPQDDTQAVKWYRKAAEQGHVKALCNLGFMYSNGKGVSQDDTEAVKWYSKAAEQGHVKAQYNLALMYDKGEGVPVNDAEAVEWYRKAAEQGHAGAQYNLALMYDKGEGVPVNDEEAVEWYRKAAEQGDSDAQYKLGLMYAKGEGLEQDYVQAHMWFSLALTQGDERLAEKANEFLGMIEAQMTPEQIAEASRLAQEWEPRKKSGTANDLPSRPKQAR